MHTQKRIPFANPCAESHTPYVNEEKKIRIYRSNVALFLHLHLMSVLHTISNQKLDDKCSGWQGLSRQNNAFEVYWLVYKLAFIHGSTHYNVITATITLSK